MLSGDGTGDGTSTLAGSALADPTFESVVTDLENAVQVLRAGTTGLLTAADHLALLARTETAKRALDGYQHTLINETLEQGGFDGVGGSAANSLAMLLRITVRKASERLAIAKQLGKTTAFTGKKIDPLLPHTATVARDGVADPAHVAIIRDFIRRVPPTVDAETVEESEKQLARLTHTLAPDQLRASAERILALIDPDGAEPSADDPTDRCFIHFDKQDTDGLTRGKFRIDAEFRALLESIIDATAKPGARKGKRGNGTGDDAGTDGADEPVVDPEPEPETPRRRNGTGTRPRIEPRFGRCRELDRGSRPGGTEAPRHPQPRPPGARQHQGHPAASSRIRVAG